MELKSNEMSRLIFVARHEASMLELTGSHTSIFVDDYMFGPQTLDTQNKYIKIYKECIKNRQKRKQKQ